MSEELKPCPFCGGEAIRGTFNVWCGSCRAETDKDDTDVTDQDVITAWNTRPSPWISVEDELPEETEGIWLCKTKNGAIEVLARNYGYASEWDFDCQCVTHFMPIPPLPEKGSE